MLRRLFRVSPLDYFLLPSEVCVESPQISTRRISSTFFSVLSEFGRRSQDSEHMATGQLSRNQESRVIVHLKKESDKRETASDRPSVQSKVRLTTVRPVLLRRKSYIVLRARILAPFKAHTKVAAFGRHHFFLRFPLYVL